MRTQLLLHNKIAYKKIEDALNVSNRTCVVHPTGTGKSFLIAAVSEKYKKVLVLGPNNFVLEQVQQVLSWRKDGVEYMTYQMLCFVGSMLSGYDLICLDEFHRAGAPEWGDAIEELLKNNPTAKVFGTSATPIRDNDNDRNMADELFDGHVASAISIAEAWNRGILPVPTYVTGLFDFANVSLQAKDAISNSKYLSEKEKKQRLTRLNNLRLEWERSDGMSLILNKYIQKDARRVIVFCAHISQLNSMKHTVEKWFNAAGFNIAKTLCVHADMTDGSVRRAMEEFERDDFDGIKLMLSVNMLNEGVHIPRVNAVLMLRTTSSRIIYMQQLGRCLTAANTEKPVVLDMVDNMNYTNAIHSIRDEFNRLEIERSENYGEQPARKFFIRDHCKSYREMVLGLTAGATNNWETDEEAVRSVVDFVKSQGRLPNYSILSERKLYYKMMERRTVMEQDETIGPLLKLLRKHGEDGVLHTIQLIRDFIKEYGRLPRKHEKPYYGKWVGLRNSNKDNPEVISIQRDYCARHMTDFEATDYAKRIIKFIEENHRQPNQNHDEEERILSLKARVLRKSYPTRPYVPELVELLKQYGQSSDEEVLNEVIAFEKENGRMPTCASEHNLYMKMNNRRERLRNMSAEFDALCRKYYFTKETPTERFELLKKYCEEHGHLPSRRIAPEEYKYVWYLKQNPIPEFEELMKTYKPYLRVTDEAFKMRISTIKEFAEKHGRLPSTQRAEERQESLWWERLKRHHRDMPEVAALLENYPRLREKNTQMYAEKRRKEKEAKKEAKKLPKYTKRQSKLRNYGKKKFGYIVRYEENFCLERRFNIYYDEQTHRVPSYERSCLEAGLNVLPVDKQLKDK